MPPKGPTLKGLDISHYDGRIDFKKVRDSGRAFAFAKCSEYTGDATFKTNKKGCKDFGILFGGYHFFHPSRDPRSQAELFLQLARPEKGELRPVLDWESTDNVPGSTDRARARLWLDTVEHAVGKPPIIYGGPYFLQALNLDASFARYPLWIAHYGTSAPLVPAPWRTWDFWQFTDKGDVPGIPAADEDLDLFNGSIHDLQALVL